MYLFDTYLVAAIDTLFAEQLKQLKPNVLSATSNNKQKIQYICDAIIMSCPLL